MSMLHNGKRSSLYAGPVGGEWGEIVYVISADICPSGVEIAAIRHQKKPRSGAE